MKKVYNLIFIVTIILIGGLITNVDAVSLSNSDGRITVTRSMQNVRNSVTNTFKYGVQADSANPASVTGLPSSFNIVFNNVSPVIETGQWYGTATQTGTLDLTGINFTKAGNYAFYLWEQNSSNPSNYPIDDSNCYIIHISVRNVVDGNNIPTGVLTAQVAFIVDDSNAKISQVSFIRDFNIFDNNPVLITKEVQGNMANPDEYFKVLVDIDCPSGNEYQIQYYDGLNNTDNVDRTINYNGNSINRLPNSEVLDEGTEDERTFYYATYTCGQSNYVYLKHGETVGLLGLLNETEYSFTEQDATNYNTYINGSSTNSKSSGTLSTPEIETSPDRSCVSAFGSCRDSVIPPGGGPKSNLIGKEKKPKNMANESPTFPYDVEEGQNIILNVETSEVPTGVILKYLPYAILILVVIGSFVLLLISKRKVKKSETLEG